jgi:hypothetical protein
MTNNIIFWLDGDITYFGLAKHLQSLLDCNISAILDITDQPKKFFQHQKIINFKKVWFYHDFIKKSNKKPDLKYLEQFEEKYGINLWTLAYNERLFFNFNFYYKFNRDEILSILEQECKLFEMILDELKPDFLIMPQTNLHHNHLFHELCKSKGIKILMLGPSRFGYRSIISTDSEKIDDIFKIESSQLNQETWEDLQKYLQRFDSFKNSTQWKKRFLTSKLDHIKAASAYLFNNNSNVKTHYTYYGRTKINVLTKQIFYLLVEKYRAYFIDKFLTKNLNSDRPFIYFPLHEEPEAILLLNSPFYTNQLELIKQIAKSLPIGYDLFVKEHFIMNSRGWRKTSFYKELMNLPNVQLIHPTIPPKQILERCSLVINIAGTSGLEAALNKKPCIIFSDTLYDKLPSVTRVRNIEDLPSIIKNSLKMKVNPSDIIEYAKFIDENSFEFDGIGIGLDANDHFYHGGFLIDTEITPIQMESFLQKHYDTFEKFALEHVKKINYYNTHM